MNVLRLHPRFKKAYAGLEEVKKNEQWVRQEVENYQLEQINATWRHASHFVHYYRQLKIDLRLPDSFSSLNEFRERVPILRKEIVRKHHEHLISERPKDGWWTRTGGSTGTPMRAYIEAQTHDFSLQTRYRFQQMWDLDIFDKVAWMWGHSGSFAPGVPGLVDKIVTPIEDKLRARLRLSAYHLSTSDLRRYLKRIKVFKPKALYGYASALQLLAREARTNNFACRSLHLCILTGEPVTVEAISDIESAFNVRAVVEYGSHECGFIAHSWQDGTTRVREDRILAETSPRIDGKHDLFLTLLGNQSFPLLRYEIEDTTDYPIEYPNEGFAILGNVAGRNNDLIVTRTGAFLHSARFDAFFKYQCKGIRRFRMHQFKSGQISTLIELEERATDFDRSSTQRAIERLVEGFPVTLETVREIPPSTAGKHRLIVSELATQRNN